jgi:hypothetical protein
MVRVVIRPWPVSVLQCAMGTSFHARASRASKLDVLDHGAAIGGCSLGLELVCDCRIDKRPCRIEPFAYEPVIDGAVLLGEYMVVTGKSGTPRRGGRAEVAVLRCPHCGRNPRMRHARMVKLLQNLVRRVGHGRHVRMTLASLERGVL